MDPFVTAHIGGRIDSFAFDQFLKLFRRAFERQSSHLIVNRNAYHLYTDAEAKISTPFDVFGGTGKRKAEFPELLDIHLRFRKIVPSCPQPVPRLSQASAGHANYWKH